MSLENLRREQRRKKSRGPSQPAANSTFRHAWGICQDADPPTHSPQGLSDPVDLRGCLGSFCTLNSYLSASNLGPVTVIFGSGKFHVTPRGPPNFLFLCGFPLQGWRSVLRVLTTTPSLALSARLVTDTSAAGS